MVLSLLLLLLHLPNPLKVSRSLYSSAPRERKEEHLSLFFFFRFHCGLVDYRKTVFRTLPSSRLTFLPTFIYTGIHYILRDFERVP